MTMRNIFRPIAILLCGAVFSACSDEKQLFRKLDAEDSGIRFENTLNSTDDFNIIDYIYFYNGGGVCVGDINGDSLPDIFFSGNQVKNKLYLNKGDLKFEDITDRAGVGGNSTWNTGSVMADVNGDGLLDIYVCAVVGLKNLVGHNELFINNGDNTFSERSAEFGLDFESYSSTAAFLDFDRDGDLDMYLLSHAIHTPESFGHADLRKTRTYESGGKLLRNDGEKFTDVSEAAGIYGGVNGYGLGLAISDFNVDGYPDIFVGNDFHEDDYFYVNNGDGTFSEKGEYALTSMSKFSMGNDVADINHDGLPDLITLDMLPEDEQVLKRSVDEENISIMKLRTGKYGYNYQFPRNTLQINQGNGRFAETALMSNVAATDWSWSALFCDFDQDGNQDLFVSNGIPRRPNDLDYIKYVSSDEVKKTIETTKIVDQKALSLMPNGEMKNYVFKGSGSYGFENKSDAWLPDEKTCSTASAYGDLDNDGDLDLVVNNVNAGAQVYINQNDDHHYLKIRLKYQGQNPFGIGARVYSFHRGIMQMKEMYSVRGFQASSEPIIHFGYGDVDRVDSLKVVWPNGTTQKLLNAKTGQSLTISVSNPDTMPAMPAVSATLFEPVDEKMLGLSYEHKEDAYTDFDRLKLLPYQQSDRGPATAVGDLNNDGKADLYFGGSKHIPGQIFLQNEKGFVKTNIPELLNDSVREDVDAVIADFNGDKKQDIYIGSGGADFYGKSKPLLDSYYLAGKTGFESRQVDEYFENASCIKAFDFDNDGDLDLFVGNESVSDNFGKIPRSCLLVNDSGKFEPTQQEVFANLGMVTDAAWTDFNGDGKVDLVVVGEWMQPTFLRNTGSGFEREDLAKGSLSGLWQSILPFDIDEDGDVDYLLGNWGLNSKFKASDRFPMKMFYGDFDKNGKSETVVAIEKKGNYYPLDGFDMIASQIPGLKKKYTTYQSFAGKQIHEIFSRDELDRCTVLEVHELASGWLKNENSKFSFVPFAMDLQISPIMAMAKDDFDGDGKQEVILGGNYFGVQPFHGRYASFPGAVIRNVNSILSGNTLGLNMVNRSVRHFNVISVQDQKYLLVTMNNDSVQLYKMKTKK